MRDSDEVVDLSVIVPCFNEVDNVGPLAEELGKVLEGLDLTSEILFVDDASTDATRAALAALEREHSGIRVLGHTRNVGESAAQATGFREARGRWIVTMDGDGQNDPADLPRLVSALHDADVVCGVRRRRADTWVKQVSSRVANAFRNAVTGDRIQDAGCTYRAFRRTALEEVPVFNGMHRFLPTLLRAQGCRIVEIEVNDRPRTRGVSKYGIGNRLFRGITDCLAIRWWRRRAVPGPRWRSDVGSDRSRSERPHRP